jgi:predicted dehydrogenase
MRTVAVLGCGKRGTDKVGHAIGHAHAHGWRTADPACKLYGVDPNPDNLRAFADAFSLPPQQLFASTDALYAALTPDFVSVCTWPALHAPQVVEAANRGVRGIVCEKPMALDVAEIHAMVGACQQKNAKLAIAHQRRYQPMFQAARQLIRDGALGTMLALEARVGDDWDILSWTVHWFDMASFLFDDLPASVLAAMDHRGERRYGHAVEHGSMLFVEYAKGHQATFITGPRPLPAEWMVVRGEKGMLRIGDRGLELFSTNGYSTPTPDPALQASFKGDFAALMSETIAAVETGAPILCGADRCAIATELAYAAYESARTMKKVSMPANTFFAPLEVAQRPPLPLGQLKKVVLYADEHFGSQGREGIAEALRDLCGHEPTVIDAAKQPLRSADLADADLLVLYHTQPEPASETKQSLEQWVAAGKPLLMTHAALGGYPNWDAYKQWCGRVWVWTHPGGSEHPYEPSELIATRHPAGSVGFDRAWLPRDEVFIKLGATAEVHDLMTVKIPQGEFPAAWRHAAHRNVATWVPGHRRDLWLVPAMRHGFAATIRSLLVP